MESVTHVQILVEAVSVSLHERHESTCSPNQLGINCSIDWVLWLWLGNQHKRRKTLNSNQLHSTWKLTLCYNLPVMKRWSKYILEDGFQVLDIRIKRFSLSLSIFLSLSHMHTLTAQYGDIQNFREYELVDEFVHQSNYPTFPVSQEYPADLLKPFY